MEERDHDPSLLAAYLEDRLDGVEKERLIGHLATCADCRGTLALLGRAASDLRLPSPPLRPRQEGSWRVPLRTWLPLAASVAIATSIALRLISAPPSETGGPRTPERSEPLPRDLRPSPTPAAAASATPRGPGAAPTITASGRPAADVIDESLLAKRSATRHVAGKAFRSMEGAWVDISFDPAAALPVVEVKGAEARAALLSRLPDLRPYTGLGDRVVVLFEGTVYRFAP